MITGNPQKGGRRTIVALIVVSVVATEYRRPHVEPRAARNSRAPWSHEGLCSTCNEPPTLYISTFHHLDFLDPSTDMPHFAIPLAYKLTHLLHLRTLLVVNKKCGLSPSGDYEDHISIEHLHVKAHVMSHHEFKVCDLAQIRNRPGPPPQSLGTRATTRSSATRSTSLPPA
jgi:hypothetical protein